MKTPTLTLVIICYNEEKAIGPCLDAIAAQTILPDEVIVVDNDSTDNTARIAGRYSFVTVVKEQVRGMIPARNRGFDEATGEILGRIDADTLLSPTWTAELLDYFVQHLEVAGVSGPAHSRSLKILENKFVGRCLSLTYYAFSYSNFGTRILWGSNMALRRTTWLGVRNSICNDDAVVHEDEDISLCMTKLGYAIGYCPAMLVNIDAHNILYLPTVFEYIRKQYTTSRWQWQHDGYKSSLRRLPLRIILSFVQIPGLILYLLCALWYTTMKTLRPMTTYVTNEN